MAGEHSQHLIQKIGSNWKMVSLRIASEYYLRPIANPKAKPIAMQIKHVPINNIKKFIFQPPWFVPTRI
jgi:hypothetical protein